MDFKEIIYTKEEGVATITLNRPQALNVLTDTMDNEWVAAIQDAKTDPEVRVVVVTGAGRAFCAGASPRNLAQRQGSNLPVKEFLSTAQHWYRMAQRWTPVAMALRDLHKPYLGAINGAAVGAGMDLACMCDIRIASDQARFGTAYTRMGTTPAQGGSFWLPRLVGIAHASELLGTSRLIDAQEALEIGLVSHVVPQEALMPAVKEFALKIARGPALAIQMSKMLIYQCLSLDLYSALLVHEEALILTERTEDAKEGPRAYVEKREPIFKGR